MSFCMHCGSPLSADDRFCQNCGTPVGSVQPGAQPGEQIKSSPDVQDVVSGQANQVPTVPELTMPAMPQKTQSQTAIPEIGDQLSYSGVGASSNAARQPSAFPGGEGTGSDTQSPTQGTQGFVSSNLGQNYEQGMAAQGSGFQSVHDQGIGQEQPIQSQPVVGNDFDTFMAQYDEGEQEYATGSAAQSPVLADPTVPMAATSNANSSGSATSSSSTRRMGIIVAIISVIAVIAIVTTVILGHQLASERAASTASNTSASAASPSSSASSDSSSTTSASPDSSSADAAVSFSSADFDSIIDAYSTTDVAVSISTVGADATTYDSKQSNQRLVAAGLYLPVYLAATNNGETSNATASDMMSSMNNDAANQLIADLGGTQGVNAWLSSHGYASTELQRNYGDVAASNEGKENYTSAQDAVAMLNAVAKTSAVSLMSVDVASSGVTIPEGMTVAAHRGSGIQNSVNYFLIVKDKGVTVSVAIMTHDQGDTRAAQLTTAVLSRIHRSITKK